MAVIDPRSIKQVVKERPPTLPPSLPPEPVGVKVPASPPPRSRVITRDVPIVTPERVSPPKEPTTLERLSEPPSIKGLERARRIFTPRKDIEIGSPVEALKALRPTRERFKRGIRFPIALTERLLVESPTIEHIIPVGRTASRTARTARTLIRGRENTLERRFADLTSSQQRLVIRGLEEGIIGGSSSDNLDLFENLIEEAEAR